MKEAIYDIPAGLPEDEFERRFDEARTAERNLLEQAVGKRVVGVDAPLDGGDRPFVDLVFEDGTKLQMSSCSCCFGITVTDDQKRE
jgi:hypothetical protein